MKRELAGEEKKEKYRNSLLTRESALSHTRTRSGTPRDISVSRVSAIEGHCLAV